VTWAQQFDTVRSLLINDQTWPPALPLEADF
jgi:hypothetical protein